jgi:hypothetical protein
VVMGGAVSPHMYAPVPRQNCQIGRVGHARKAKQTTITETALWTARTVRGPDARLHSRGKLKELAPGLCDDERTIGS